MPQKNPFDTLLEDDPQQPQPAPTFQNPFDDILAQPDREQEQRMRAARKAADETSPTKRADALKLATQTGLPVDVVERNFDSISRRLAVDRYPYTAVQQQAPALAEWSTQPDNAAIAADDMANMGYVEWVLKAPSRAFAQQVNRIRWAELKTKALFRPLTREEQDAMNSFKFHADLGGDLAVGESFWAKAMTGAGRLLAQAVEPAKYAVVGGIETAAIGAAGGSVIPGVGTTAGALTGFGYGARAGAMYGVFKSTAMQETAETYDELLATKDETGRPIDPDVARIAALTVGGLNGLIEQVGLEAFLTRFPGLDKLGRGASRDAIKAALRNPTVRAGFAKLAKSYAGGLSTEVATEVAQRAVTIAGEELAKYAAGPEFAQARRSATQVWDDLVITGLEAIPEFAFGMLPGPALGFARDVARAKQAEQAVAVFQALGEGVQQSQTAQRVPAAFERFVADVTRDGPVKEVYAPVASWTTYWQQQGVDPAQMAAEVTGRPDALEAAQQSGNLAIPTARYAATLAGTEHNAALAQELRLGSPDAMNAREAAEFKERVEVERQRVLDQVKAERESAAVRATEAAIEQQLVEANVPRGTAKTTAQALAGIANMAERAGFDPTEVFASYGLKVERRLAAEGPAETGGPVIGQTERPVPPPEGEIPGLADLEASLGGATMATLDPSTGAALNASADSAASLEALSRQEGMRSRGEQFVVYDRAGRRRVLLGPDAVDYRPRRGETYGVESLDGFRTLDDQGGRVPTRESIESRLGRAVGRVLGQGLAPIPPGRRVEGELGPANEAGVRAQFVGYQPGFGDIPTMALYNVFGGERDGSTLGADELRRLGVPIPPTPPLLEYQQRQLATTPQLRAWFGNSAVVDDEGQPLIVFHGTTRVFTTFDQERANIESDFGAGFYFSNNPEDVGANYAGIGPDLEAKIERRAEQLEQERDLPMNDPQTRAEARAEFVETEGLTIPVFLKIENPAVIGGPNETRLTYELVEDPETGDIVDEKGTLLDFVQALRDVGAAFYDFDADEAITKLVDAGIDGELPLSKVIEILKGDERFGYATDENGQLVSNEIVRQALEATGFDGIIDHTVDIKFGSQRRVGKAMAGMDEDTVHYIAFKPTQIKSALFNRGTFDPADPNILFQSARMEELPAQAAFYSRLDRAVRDAKQQKGTGAQWKGIIRNAKIGVNKDEFALAKVEDLDDATTYSKDEVLAYLKTNRPKVDLVILEGPAYTDDELRERADEIFDEMAQEAENEIDWDDYIGTATYVEDTDTREVLQLDENGDPVLDEDGNEVYEEEEVTVYWPAVNGGYRPRGVDPVTGRRRYGVEPRRGDEIIEDAESYDNEDDAERAARDYLADVDREPFYEMISEAARESIDYSDAEEEARRQLEREGGGAGGGRYSEYVLEPEAEEDSYKEVFITAPGRIEKPVVDPRTISLDTIKQNIARSRYERDYAALDEGMRESVDTTAQQIYDENQRQTEAPAAEVYRWKDGHDLYNDIENPVVRIRLNARREVTVQPAQPLDQAVMQAGIEARAERDALYTKAAEEAGLGPYDPRRMRAREVLDSMTDEERRREAELSQIVLRAEDALRASQQQVVEREPVLFIEEIQPPRPEQQKNMPPIFLKNWREMAFKWLLKFAVDEGFSKIAWTTGQQQADRYSLTKKVNKITHGLIAEDTQAYLTGYRKFVSIDVRDGADILMHVDEQGVVRSLPNDYGHWREQLQGQPLAAVIGPELADQVMQSTDESAVIQGQGLRVGGAGLKRLYDYDFPAVVNKVPAVKAAGGRVATVKVRTKPEWTVTPADDIVDAEFAKWGIERNPVGYYIVDSDGGLVYKADAHQSAAANRDLAWNYQQANRTTPTDQPALVITPELATIVSGGQALFQSPRYRPTTSSEIATLQAQVEAVVQGALEGTPAGTYMAVTVNNSGELHIDGIQVAEAARGQGIGTKLMTAVLEWADQHNMQVSLVQAPDTGKKGALRRFYSRLGFVKNGTARFYDPSSWGTWVRPAVSERAGGRPPRRLAQGPRGAIQFAPNRQTTITLFETADLSTFLHETGHFYLEVMGDLVDKLDALDPATLTPQQHQFRTDYATVLSYLGVTARNEVEREHHEKFARAFETYLMEGRAPSLRLREAFARFRAWLVGVYRSLRALNAPLTDDVRKVFDRMLATDDAIAEAERAGALTPMFLTPEQAGMSHERFALYRQAIEEASTAARERLDRELIEEVQREQTAQWKARKAEVKAEVERDVFKLPVYRALAAMQRGRNPDGTPLVEGETPAPLKLSKALLVEQFGAERLTRLPKSIYSREGGLDAGVIAEMFGFSSGDELLAAVEAAEPMRQHINQETDRRMLVEHGSLLLDGTLVEKAQAAVADETRETVLREELRALARMQRVTDPVETFVRTETQAERDYERRWFEAEAKLRIAIAEGRKQVEIDRLEEQVRNAKRVARIGPAKIRGALPSQQALRDAAQASVARTRVRDLNPMLFWTAARKASQAATEAAARQDFDAAILAKQQELINLALYRETVRAKDDIAKRVKVAQDTGRPNAMAKLKLAGETYHDQVAGVLDRFEFAPVPKAALDRRAALWKWVQGQEAQGLAIDLPDELLDEARRVHYQDLTVEELVGVTDGLKQIVHLARFKNRLLKQHKRRQLNAVAATIATSIRTHKSKRQETVRDRGQGTERKRLVQGVLAAHRKIASLVREMDGFVDGGPLWEAIIRPLNEAGAREADMNAAATRRFAELIEAAYPRREKRRLYARTFVPAIGQSLSKMERVMIALNWGNEGNRDRIRRAEGWTDDQIQAVLDTLDERDAQFVQGVFDFIGSYWDQIAAKQERVYGLRPEKVEATPFRIVGTELRGGYFPLKYDDRLSAAAAGQLDLEAANLAKQAAFTQATTKRGHTKTRATTLDQPVRLDFGVMFEHVQQVIHDLTHHEALIDIGRILGHADVQKAIYETHGDIAYKTIKNTIRDVAFGDLPAANAFEKALNHTRTGATVVGLGWSLTTAALQPLGLANSIVRIGPKAVGRGVARLLGSPARMNATVEWIYEKSTFMRTRGQTQQRELNEIRNRVGVYSGKLSGWIDEAISKTTFNQASRQGIADSYFWFIQTMQKTVDIPTWLGAYDAAMRDGHDEDTAVALADQAVLDSQGGGQVKDLAGVQRGGPAMKLFTNFYSYFSVIYNQAVESGKRAMSKRDAASVGRVAVDYLMLFIVPATLGHFIREGLKPGDDDDEGLAEKLVVENLAYMMGLMVGLRELSGAVQGYYGYEGPAGARLFSSASRSIQQIRQGEIDEALLRSLNETAGILLHYPAAQVWRTANGIAAIAEGKTENPLAVVTGPER